MPESLGDKVDKKKRKALLAEAREMLAAKQSVKQKEKEEIAAEKSPIESVNVTSENNTTANVEDKKVQTPAQNGWRTTGDNVTKVARKIRNPPGWRMT